MEAATRDNDLEMRFSQALPAKLIDPHMRKRQIDLIRHMNGLGRLDTKTNEVFIDETAFRSMLAEFTDFLPAGFEEHYIARMKTLADNRLADGRHMKHIKWQELANHVPVLRNYPQAPTHLAHIKDASTIEELRKHLHQLVPDLKDTIFDPSTFKERYTSVLSDVAGTQAAEIAPLGLGQIWDCFVSNWGWWGAALAVAALIAIGTALGIFGPFEVVLGAIVVGVVSGYLVAAIVGLGGVAAVLVMCIFQNW